MQELSHTPLPSILPRTLPWGCRRPRSTAVQNPPALRAPAEQVRGGVPGKPTELGPGLRGRGRFRTHFLRGGRRCSTSASPADATPCHTSRRACPQPCPPAPSPSHTTLLPWGSPHAVSPLCLCSGAHPARRKTNPSIHACIPEGFLRDAEAERTRQAVRASKCPLCCQGARGHECVLLSFVSQTPSPQVMGPTPRPRLQKLPRLTGRQCAQSQPWLQLLPPFAYTQMKAF